MDVATFLPAEPFEPVPKCCEPLLPYGAGLRAMYQDADAPHPLGLLPARRERPRGHRAAEKRDERAAFHCPMPPVLRTESVAHLSTVGDCCAAGFQCGL